MACYALLSVFLLLIALSLLVISFIIRPRPTQIPVKGRHVFISGGSSGIGLALARRAAAEGAKVSILARNYEKLEEARDSIRLSTGVDVSILSADVRDFGAVSKVLDEAEPVDVLICNQGVFLPQELYLQDMKDVNFMIDVNLVGTFHLIKAALPKMRRRTNRRAASIALMSSQGGQVGIYGYTAYSATKFGLRGLGEALQQELIADDIRVSLIFPPDTDTPGFAEENNRRPHLTRVIASSSGVMKADTVAEATLNGIKSGKFIIPCNFDGVMLSIATAGFSPQTSYLMAFLEIISVGFMRMAVLYYQWSWYKAIETWHALKL